MRLNLTLLFALIALLFCAYNIDKQEDVKAEQLLSRSYYLKEDVFLEIKLPNVHLVKNTSGWELKDGTPADINLVSYLLESFKKIKTVKTVSQEESRNVARFNREREISIFIKGKKREFHFTVGDISKVTGRFYLIAKDEGESPEVAIAELSHSFSDSYRNEFEKRVKQFITFEHMLNGDDDFYLSKLPFHDVDFSEVTKVKLDNTRNRWFLLDFEREKTKPEHYVGLSYKKLKTTFFELLSKTKIKKKIRLNKKVLSQKISEITFWSNNKEEVQYRLYGMLNERSGYFLKKRNTQDIFEIEAEKKEIFFSNVQDFWSKSIHYAQDLAKVKRIDFKLGKTKEKMFPFYIEDITRFSVSSDSDEVSFLKNKMNFLFNLIFNLLDFKEAQYVEKARFDFKDSRGTGLWVEILDKQLFLRVERGLIELYDQDKGLKFTFLYNSSLLGEDIFNDVFTVIRK